MMENAKPLKRYPSLQPLSRDHHHGLLLCWKIRTGLSKGAAPERVKAYADWFFAEQLLPHFELEERYAFPLLGDKEHPMVKRALREHRRLRRLFTANNDLAKNLNLIEKELTAHIRYEERVFFEAVQAVASPEQLAVIEQLHEGRAIVDGWEDRFWE